MDNNASSPGATSYVLLSLTPEDGRAVHLALRRIGIDAAISTNAAAEAAVPDRSPQGLDAAARSEATEVLLIDAERLRGAAGSGRSPELARLTIALAADEAEGRAAVRDFGAFDYLSRSDDDWAGRAASYVRALCSLRRRLSGAFGALERRYEDLVHALPDIVYELDAQGRFTFVNNSVRLLGYEPSDLVGKHFSVLLYDEDAAAVDRDSVLEMFKGVNTGLGLSPKLFNERRSMERRTENLEVRLRRKPGSGDGDLIVTVISYGEVTAAGEYTRGGDGPDFVGSVGVIRDITLRRKSEEMLRKLYQAVDQLTAGILIADRNFRIEYVNPGFFRIAGLPPQEVIGAELFSFFDFKSDEAEDLRAQVRAGFDARVEVRLSRRGQEWEREASSPGSWTALHASPVRSPSGAVTHAILICEDISQRKAMEELVRIAKEEAERANRAKSDFLASMSHELKSPVASVLAAARLIEMGSSEPERRAGSIIASAQGLLDVLGDILDFVRFETGTGTVRKFAFPLPGFIARICDPYRKEAGAKGLSFELGSLPDETLRSDPDRLGRALAALLDNAVSFTESGKVRVDASIERKSGNVPHLMMSVSDTGIGIAPDDQGRIFAPFVQLASPYSKHGGAGIGLSLARNIVRALGGEIRLQSEPGKGSVFTMLVPVGEPEAAQQVQAASPQRSYRLLVVDDNEVNLEYMAAILANAGHRVDTASSGAQALALLEDRPPDAAILDIQMPGMSGIELGRKVRGYAGTRYDPGLPLVALTAFDPEEVGRSGVDFDGVFAKPVDVTRLVSFLDGAVDRREGTWIEDLGGELDVEAAKRLEAAPEQLLARIRTSIEGGDAEELRSATRVLGGYFARIGAARLEAALRRIILAFPDEEKAVLLCRADRLAEGWSAAARRWSPPGGRSA